VNATLGAKTSNGRAFETTALDLSQTIPFYVGGSNSVGTTPFFTITDIAITGADAADFTINGEDAAKASAALNRQGNFTVTFTPSKVGVHAATLVVTVSNSSSPITKSLDVEKISGDGFEIRRGALNGPVVDVTSGLKVPLTNYRVSPFVADFYLHVYGSTAVNFSGFGADSHSAIIYNFNSVPSTMQPGSSARFFFTVDSAQRFTTTSAYRVYIYHDSLAYPATLRIPNALYFQGNENYTNVTTQVGSPASAEMAPHTAPGDKQTLASTTVGTAGDWTNVWVQADGDDTFDLVAPVLGGSDASDFEIDTTDYASTVEGYRYGLVKIRLNPNSAGFKSATLTLTETTDANRPMVIHFRGVALDASSSSAQIALRNGGYAGTDVASTATTIDIGARGISSPARRVEMIVSNVGSQSLSVGTPTVSGTDANLFNVDASSMAGTLAPGEFTSFVLEFDPGSVGSKSASISIAHNSGGSQTTKSFSVGASGSATEARGYVEVSGLTTNDIGTWQFDPSTGSWGRSNLGTPLSNLYDYGHGPGVRVDRTTSVGFSFGMDGSIISNFTGDVDKDATTGYLTHKSRLYPRNNAASLYDTLWSDDWYFQWWETGSTRFIINGQSGVQTSIDGLQNQPSSRYDGVLLWNGSRIIRWGGNSKPNNMRGSFQFDVYNDGAMLDPNTLTWTPMSQTGAPEARFDCSSLILEDGRIFVWGGVDRTGRDLLNSGGIYDPSSDSWTSVTTTGAPSARMSNGIVEANGKVYIFGGLSLVNNQQSKLNTGGVYDLATGAWSALPSSSNVPARTGTLLSDGARLFALAGDPVLTGSSSPPFISIFDIASQTWTHPANPAPSSTPNSSLPTGNPMAAWQVPE